MKPTQTFHHLGVTWNFKKAELSVPKKKVAVITNLCEFVLDTTHVRVTVIESLQEKFILLEKAVPYGRIHYRSFQRDVLNHVRRGRNHRKFKLSVNAKEVLKWWSKNSHANSPCPCRMAKPKIVVTTDASLTRWGTVL